MFLKKCIFCLIMTLGNNAYALDVKTHVYVGQAVINDLADGKVTIHPYGQFAVDTNIVNSILNNQSVYLTGNIGPDGFPDIIGGQMTTHPGLESGWKTDDWLKWVVNNANNQNEIAFAYGYLSHAAADTFAHTYVNWYSGDSFDITDGEIDVELRHMFLESFIAKYQPDLTDSAGNSLNKLPHELVAGENQLPIDFINSTLLMNKSVANEYSKSDLGGYLNSMFEIRETLVDINNSLNDSMSLWDTSVEKLEELMAATSLDIDDIPVSALAGGACKIEVESRREKDGCQISLGFLGCAIYKYVTNIYKHLVCDNVEKVRDLAAEYEKFFEDVFLVQKQHDKQAAIMEAITQNWIAGIDIATKEYIKLSARTTKHMLEPVPNISAIKSDLGNWLLCYGTVFGGIPYQGTQTLCLSKDIYEDVIGLILDFNNLSDLERSLLIGYGGSEALEKMVEAEQRLKNKVKAELMEKLLGSLDTEVKYFIDTFVKDPNATLLNTQFSIDNSNKNLLLIPSVANRIQADMHLDVKGKFDPIEFNLIYNAIVLSKLSLLSPDKLNELAIVAGVSDSLVYNGAPLYNTSGPENILFSSIKSIDGNHQWMYQAPPYPKTIFDNTLPVLSFGYSENDGFGGFRLWTEPQAREKIFLKIFKGPLAPALESPSMVGYTNIIPSDYPYRSCKSNPFPLNVDDQRCTMSWLIPILIMLLQ